MSISIKEVPKLSDRYLGEAWDLKQDIREEQQLLNQDRSFFRDAYESGKVYLLRDQSELIGFAIVNNNGYLALLGIHPDHQGNGHGTEIVNSILEDYETVSCHTRFSNKKAIEFYQGLGFLITKIVHDYYRDSENALFLVHTGDT